MVSELLDRIARAIHHEKYELPRTILTVLMAFLVVLWFIWTFFKSRTGITQLPPGPRGLPVIGYIPFLGTNLHRSFTDLAHQYGPIYKLWLGNKLCVVLNSPSLAKEVVRDQDEHFANRDPPIAALVVTYGGLDIAWSPYGSYWRTMRKVFVREMLSNNSLEACYNLRKDEVRKSIRDVHNNVGKPVDIGKLTFVTGLNVVMSMLWGETLEGEKRNSVGAEFREVASKITKILGKPNISDFLPILARFDIQGVEREMKRLFQWIDRVLDSVINEHMKMGTKAILKNGKKKDFLQILLELKDQEDTTTTTTTPITITQIKALLMDIVVGGTDTSSAITEWVMAELMHNPKIMKRSQEELASVVGLNNVVEESHLPKLHYLEAVVKETFRLHPPLPLLVPRRPSQSCTVGGYTIPKDSCIFVNVWAIQRDPEVWDDPLVFKPERFLREGNNFDYSGNNFHYLPFGSGRRICAGIPLAERMVMYLLASLLHSFEWGLPKNEEFDLSEEFGIVMKKKTPLTAIPTQRLSSLELYI